MSISPEYRSFQQLRRESGLRSGEIANEAGVSLTEEYLFEIGGVVDRETKKKIVQAFSRLTNRPYTLETFEPGFLSSDATISSEETIALKTISPAPPPTLPKGAKGAKHGEYLH